MHSMPCGSMLAKLYVAPFEAFGFRLSGHLLPEDAQEEMSRDALAVDRLKNDVTAAHMVRGCSILLQFAAQVQHHRDAHEQQR